MGVAVNIISAVLKSVVGDKIGNELANELIGISIDEISEKGIDKISDFINGEKSKIDHILSKENMKSMGIPEESIDYVVEEIKDLFSRINITDEVFRRCQYDNTKLSVFLWDEYHKDKGSYIECENGIKRCLFKIAQVLIELLRESEDFEKDFLIQISNSVDDTNIRLQRVSDYIKANLGRINESSQMVLNILLMILEQMQKMNMQDNETKSTNHMAEKFQNNKKQDYIKIWNSRLFLHLDNDERPITLADAFIMPDVDVYYYHSNINESEHEAFEQILRCFLNDEKASVLLIAGVPGIGKTSTTSWFANKYKEDDRVIILRFRDWDYNDFRNGLLNAICDTLCCNRKDLSDKILVLDGFDEIKCLDRRRQILNEFNNDINDLERSKIIITSRSSYIDQVHFNSNIVLRPFNIEKIKEFYKNITGKVLNERDIDTNNLDVLGVPVILYMAIMSDIDITKTATKPELYNRIFAERGGIFDKFCEYDSGSQIMRNSDNIVCYLDFLRTVAFKMFEKNELVLSRNECKIPMLSFQGKDVSVLEFPIKHLFENTSSNIEFIHKSIYEYFVSEYIYKLIDNILLKEETLEVDLAGVLGDLLSKQRLSDEILEFMKYKIRNGNFSDKFYIVNETFQLMLKDGMTFHTGKCYRNVMDCELNIFVNMLEIVHLWKHDTFLYDKKIIDYIKWNKAEEINLEKVDLNMVKLRGVYLKSANLTEAKLKGADLSRANLKEANLKEANLIGAKLYGADLIKANLIGAKLYGTELGEADLSRAIFDEKTIQYLKQYYNLRGTRVYIKQTQEVIDYQEYCKRNQ